VFSAFYNQVPFIFPKPELLSISSSAARRRPPPGPVRRPTALRPFAPRSTCRAALPPAARVAHAGRPSSLHIEPMSRAAATLPRQTRRCRPLFCAGWVISLSLSISPTNLALLQN
jgi:hypothetical protein